jgi:hypothetical protein
MAPHRHSFRSLLLIGLTVALCAPAGANARLIVNGNFQRGLSGWKGVSSSLRVVRQGKQSRNAVRVTARRRAQVFVLRRSRVLTHTVPGRAYRLGAWIRGRNARVCLSVRERVGREIVGSGQRCLRAGPHWRRVWLSYRAQAHGRLRLAFSATKRARREHFFVDDVTFARAAAPSKGKHSAPVNTASPTIQGDAVVGTTLLGLTGSWTGTFPIAYSYRWRRCDASGQRCGDVKSAVNPTDVLTAGDAGSTFRLAVTARNKYGSATATSTPTAVVQDPAAPPPPPPAPPPPPLPPPPPPPPAPGPDIGVNFHCGWSDYTDEQRAEVLDRLKAAGAKWVRMDIGWSSLEESGPGQLSQWYVDVIDHCVDMARARGLNVLGMLFRTPAWANGGKGVMVPPLDDSDFAWIAHWAAAHFQGRVQAWEIWNEPDPNQASWSWSGTVAQYVQLLKAAYPAIKSGDPNALVVFGGPSWNDTSFISSAYADGAKGSFDVMAVHEYQAIANLAPEQVGDGKTWWFTRAGAIHDLMVANGDGDKKIWFTEFGWSSHANTSSLPNWQLGVTDAQQGDYLVRAIEYATAHYPYVTNMFWYDERNQSGTDIQNANFGLLTHDLAPKPAYYALQAYLTG